MSDKKKEIKRLEKILSDLDRTAGGQANTGIPELDRPRQKLRKYIKELKGS